MHSFVYSAYQDNTDRRHNMPLWRAEQSMQSASGYSEMDKKPVDNSMSSNSREMDDELRGLDELMESFLQKAQQDNNEFYSHPAVGESRGWSAHTQMQTRMQSVRASAPSRLGAPGRRVYTHTNDSLMDTSDSMEAYQVPELEPESEHVAMGETEAEAQADAQTAREVGQDLNESVMTGGGSTTMSVLDSSFLHDTTIGDGHGEAVIAFGSRREVDDALSVDEDMKEVTLSCAPGAFTTLVLTFRNQRKRTMTLKPAAILVRFDKLGHFWDSNRSDNQSSLICPSGGVFQVSPRVLQLEPGTSANLYLTFSPNQEAQGVYGGALKIKSRGKSFVLLLRGGARGGTATRPCRTPLPLPLLRGSSSNRWKPRRPTPSSTSASRRGHGCVCYYTDAAPIESSLVQVVAELGAEGEGESGDSGQTRKLLIVADIVLKAPTRACSRSRATLACRWTSSWNPLTKKSR